MDLTWPPKSTLSFGGCGTWLALSLRVLWHSRNFATTLKETKLKRQKGFSLIELLIVVAIILIIAAIAIPNLLKSKMAANESGAAGTVRTINTGEATFSTMCPQIGYSAALVDMGPTGATCPSGVGIIDKVLASGTKSGYVFTEAGTDPIGTPPANSTFHVTAVPETYQTTGIREFCSSQTNVIYYSTTNTGCVFDDKTGTGGGPNVLGGQ